MVSFSDPEDRSATAHAEVPKVAGLLGAATRRPHAMGLVLIPLPQPAGTLWQYSFEVGVHWPISLFLRPQQDVDDDLETTKRLQDPRKNLRMRTKGGVLNHEDTGSVESSWGNYINFRTRIRKVTSR